MTASPLPEPLEAFPIPDDAVLLEQWDEASCERDLAIAALQLAMKARRLSLPLGPQLDLTNPERLLSFNRFAVQVVCGGFLADQLSIPLAPWKAEGASPQLLLAARVDVENGVVDFPGVLTSTELQALAPGSAERWSGQQWLELDAEAFKGGIDRLFTLVQLLDPTAIPRLSSAPSPARPVLSTAVRDWLEGLLPTALSDLGAELVPITAGAFRQGGASAERIPPRARTILSIPLGLASSRELLWGEASRNCIERFRLLLIPTAEHTSGTDPLKAQLVVRLAAEQEGDLLPDGLVLKVQQGDRCETLRSAGSTVLELTLPAAAATIAIELTAEGGTPLTLPPLRLDLA